MTIIIEVVSLALSLSLLALFLPYTYNTWSFTVLGTIHCNKKFYKSVRDREHDRRVLYS